MNRTVVMTLGFLLVFFGIQLNVVDSYVLTPRMANFLSEQLPESQIQTQPGVTSTPQSPIAQVGFAANGNANNFGTPARVNQTIRPPTWLGWPVMFMGAVFFLNGLSIRKS